VVVLAIAAGWALAGLTVLVPVMHRVDVDGAMLLPLLAWFLLRSPRATMFAAIFVAVTELELVGTAVGTWYWLPVAPYVHSHSGNPPSAVAGGYGVIDGTVLLVSYLLAGFLQKSRFSSRLLPGFLQKSGMASRGGGAGPASALQVAVDAQD
jgi:hypothetical protein